MAGLLLQAWLGKEGDKKKTPFGMRQGCSLELVACLPPRSHAALQKATDVEMRAQGWDWLLGFLSSWSLGPQVVQGCAGAISRQQES